MTEEAQPTRLQRFVDRVVWVWTFLAYCVLAWVVGSIIGDLLFLVMGGHFT